jgi:hypothetical protein
MKPAIVNTEKKICSWVPDGSPKLRQTGRLTVGRNLTSALVVSERVTNGYGYCVILTSEWLHHKLQTRPLAREGVLHEEVTVRLKENLKLVMGTKGVPDTKANWPTDSRSQNQLRLLQQSVI